MGHCIFFISFSYLVVYSFAVFTETHNTSVNSVELLGNVMSGRNHSVDQNCGLQLCTPRNIGVYVH